MNDLHVLRMVIQYLGFHPAYRVVVYGDNFNPRHADFEHEYVLLEALRLSLPTFDISIFRDDELRGKPGTVLFADQMVLTNRQLELLHLPV